MVTNHKVEKLIDKNDYVMSNTLYKIEDFFSPIELKGKTLNF